jgi:hypothetical protein
MLQLNELSSTIQVPFAIPTNFSSGQVLFAASSSSSGEVIVDFVSASLYCAEASTTAAAAAFVATGIEPLVVPLQIERAVFAFVPAEHASNSDVCWSDTKLSEMISGQTLIVDGSWSLFDDAQEHDFSSVVMQTSDSLPMSLERDTSISVVAVVGSTILISAFCSAPSCVTTWVISKHFDIDITNSSSGQNGRFNPRPHHGGGKFRVCCVLHLIFLSCSKLFVVLLFCRFVFDSHHHKCLGFRCSLGYTALL